MRRTPLLVEDAILALRASAATYQQIQERLAADGVHVSLGTICMVCRRGVDAGVELLTGDCRAVLPTLPSASVQCCVTSPPYFHQRDYGHADQIGREKTPQAYVAALVAVFREARRVLRDDGTLWLCLGDTYNNRSRIRRSSHQPALHGVVDDSWAATAARGGIRMPIVDGVLKEKDLLMIPARVALALQEDGWYLRQAIVWHKASSLPESVRDRPTSAHETVFLLSKRKRYLYDADAIAEPAGCATTRNARNVWTIPSSPLKGHGHGAVMPMELARRCVLAGSRPGDVVLDPFGGVGTTALVARTLGRRSILIEQSAAYVALARTRLRA